MCMCARAKKMDLQTHQLKVPHGPPPTLPLGILEEEGKYGENGGWESERMWEGRRKEEEKNREERWRSLGGEGVSYKGDVLCKSEVYEEFLPQ